MISGAEVTDTIGATLPAPLVIGVHGRNGKAQPGAAVRFESRRLGVSPFPFGSYGVHVGGFNERLDGEVAFATTDALGRAQVPIRFGEIAGAAFVIIQVPELGLQDSVRYTVLPGAAAAVSLDPADTVVYVGAAYTYRFRVSDRLGNARTDSPGFTHPASLAISGGAATAQSIDRAMVVATAGRAADTSFVSVVPRGTLAAGLVDVFDVRFIRGIAITELDGSNRRVHASVDRPSYSSWSPYWSPDGSRVVFSSGSLGQLYLLDPAGSIRLFVDRDRYPVEAMRWPQYSRDGAWVYFAGAEPSVAHSHIWRIRPDGTGLQQLTRDSISSDNNNAPSPSPDGTRVVLSYANLFSSVPPRLVVLNLGTRTRQSLGVNGRTPRWSPRGDLIAYVGPDYEGLYVVRPDGTGSRKLYTGTVGDGVDWSPDGSWLVVRGGDGLMLLNAQSGLRLPLSFAKDLVEPSWRP